jgi:hypothetical protein
MYRCESHGATIAALMSVLPTRIALSLSPLAWSPGGKLSPGIDSHSLQSCIEGYTSRLLLSRSTDNSKALPSKAGSVDRLGRLSDTKHAINPQSISPGNFTPVTSCAAEPAVVRPGLTR